MPRHAAMHFGAEVVTALYPWDDRWVRDEQDDALQVVLVEDDPGIRLLVSEQLRGYDVAVHPVDPADTDPLAAIARMAPDAVILDWRMPGTTGIDLCRALRATPEAQRVAIVLLTGLSDSRDREVARHAGADAFLVKGMSADQLANALTRAVHQRRALVDAAG